MSKSYASSNKLQNSSTNSSTSLSSSESSVAHKYNSSGAKTTSIQNASTSNKVNITYHSRSNNTIDAKVHSTVDKASFVTNKKAPQSSCTPVYQPRERSHSSPNAMDTPIKKPPPYSSASNYSIFNNGLSSKPKQTIQTAPNKSQGLFYSFDDKQASPKQSIIVPAFVTSSAIGSNTLPKSTPVGGPTPLSSNRKRGYALILNHYKYENDCPSKREGTQYDIEQLKIIFDYYKIETHIQTDLKLNQIKTEVNILKYKDFTKYECFIIVILTHGKRNEILWAYDESYNFIQVIEDPLLMENKTLLAKPKIFVIQACRGNEKMPVLETDNIPSLGRRQSTVVKRNVFKCNATYEGYVSFRNTEVGTIFIQTFCRKLKEMGKFASIYDVMMKVIDEVSNDPEIPQVPTVQSSMTNSFCFGIMLK